MSKSILTAALNSAAKLSGLLWIAFACGCMDATIHFDAGTLGKISVQENTRASAWQATARVGDSRSGLRYKLAGTDAQIFSIDQTTGEVFFKTAPDFEQPLDADKNNEYRIEVEASHNGQVAVQTVFITVNNVFNPQLELVSPKMYENIGDGTEKQVAIQVQFIDAESRTPLDGDSVVVNATRLQRDAKNPQLWNGTLTVPEGGLAFKMYGTFEGDIAISSSGEVLNKAHAISPTNLLVNPSTYLVTYDAQLGQVGKLNLQKLTWDYYVVSHVLKNTPGVFDFNSGQQFFYALVDQRLYAVNITRAVPEGYLAGCFADTSFRPLSLVYDLRQKRILLLSQQAVNGAQQLRVIALATDDTVGLVDARERIETCFTPTYSTVWELPSSLLPGTFKHFNLHRESRTLIFADERFINNQPVTVVQGFSETGEKRFEAQVGPDSSNLAVNQAEGIIYLAERHSSAAGKIKTINISTGEVGDLQLNYRANQIGAYTDLRMDNPNKILYIADDVSDSLFKIELGTKILSTIEYTRPSLGIDLE